MTQQLQNIIDTAWEQRADISPNSASAELRDAVAHVLAGLDDGSLRVAQKDTGTWVVNQWLKKAVLLSFRLENNVPVASGDIQFYDKVPTKFADYTPEDFARGGFRVVPPAVARRGSFIGKNVVLMPSYVNIGAYVDEGTMSTPGPRSVRARRSARTSTCRVAWASAACSNRCRPTRPSSKTTASSARVPRSSKA